MDRNPLQQLKTDLIDRATGNVCVIGSPNVALAMDLLGIAYSTDTSKKYDTVLCDLGDYHIEHDNTSLQVNSFWHHISDSIGLLETNGTLIAKVPAKIIRYLQAKKHNINVTHIKLVNNVACVTIKTGDYISTTFSYDEDTHREVDVINDLILPSINAKQQKIVDLFNANPSKRDYTNITVISGKDMKNGVGVLNSLRINKDMKCALVIPVNAKTTKAIKLEEYRMTSGCRIYIFDNKELRDKYITALDSSAVRELQLDLSYGGYLSVKVSQLLLHPEILNYA